MYVGNVSKIFTARVEMFHLPPSITKTFFNLLCSMM